MGSPQRATTAQTSALSVAGAAEGLANVATSTAEQVFDLSAYANSYVHIYCETADLYYAFMADAVTVLALGAAAVPTPGVPRRVDQGGQGVHEVVPSGAAFLRYRTVVGAGTVRVTPS